jgi:hypothetical protein
MSVRAAVLTICVGAAAPLLLLAAASSAACAHQVGTAGDTFSGTWSASGARQALPAGGGRVALVVHVSGAVVLNADSAIGRGFQGEAIAFDDGVGMSAGRAVWTDARGDRIFSALTGEMLQTGRRVAATITGGTGRYAGATGSYELTWRYVVSAEGDDVQGRAIDLRGRIRRDEGS